MLLLVLFLLDGGMLLCEAQPIIGVERILKQGGCCCKTDGAKQGDLVLIE